MSGSSEPPTKAEQWGAGTKTARPTSVGPHDVAKEQEDPGNPGLDPAAAYKPGAKDSEAGAGPEGAAKPEMVAGAGVKPAEGGVPPGKARDAPPFSGMAQE